MPISNSIGNQLNRFDLAVKGARSYAGQLPKESTPAATNLEKLVTLIGDLNAKQEKAKQEVATLTQKINENLKQAQIERSKIVRFAEATFGPKDARLREFRPATEGRSRTPKTAATK